MSPWFDAIAVCAVMILAAYLFFGLVICFRREEPFPEPKLDKRHVHRPAEALRLVTPEDTQ